MIQQQEQWYVIYMPNKNNNNWYTNSDPLVRATMRFTTYLSIVKMIKSFTKFLHSFQMNTQL